LTKIYVHKYLQLNFMLQRTTCRLYSYDREFSW